MKIDGRSYRTIWPAADGWRVEIIDQTKLPHGFETVVLESEDQAAHAIRLWTGEDPPLEVMSAAALGELARRS